MKKEISIQLFARLRESLNQETLSLSMAPPLTPRKIKEELCRLYPNLSSTLQNSRLAINLEFVSEDEEVDDGGEMALIPPVSGG